MPALSGHLESRVRDVGDDDPARAEVPRRLGDAVPGGAGAHHQDGPPRPDVPLRGDMGADGEDVHHRRLAEGQRVGDREASAPPGGNVLGVRARVKILLSPSLPVAQVHGVRAELGQPGAALGAGPADLRADRGDPLAQKPGVPFVDDGHDLARELVAKDDVRRIVDVPAEGVHGPGILPGVITEVGAANAARRDLDEDKVRVAVSLDGPNRDIAHGKLPRRLEYGRLHGPGDGSVCQHGFFTLRNMRKSRRRRG